ncbi:uncharacterized protein K489DRAFT_383242 [Dissoconium aciculare CBS 342.82]|uniref:Uncharacterized protein n=1 Tax=Dissoconium aciculare CBS 342.82 TaxID=1314786 RepID=A0A6J3M0K4_9PEZI|nr:uncharacterized protein K489DRAFT_383242 [Dissoconium aciculare CBS 342.82]KAF1820432.1 hypothetical protein K489DRAFT_383242 [Dissoconium aciculare CBS 342.82]
MRSAVVASALVAAAVAAPLESRQSAINDGVILNYALTLEHLENTFYHEALEKFTEADFRKAGVSSEFYCNLKEIASDEATHVSFLSGALSKAGVTPTSVCTYDFGPSTVENYLAVANILEGVGVSAYLGAAQYISNKAYLTAAGSILTVEARHSAYLRDNQLKRQSPFPSPFDVPLDFDEVYSLAALFIKSCPESNPALPVKAFPAVSAAPANPAKVGDKLTLTVAKSVEAKAAYFITILGPVAAELSGSGTSYTITVPKDVQSGQEYLVLTSGTEAPTDDNIVAGPAVIEIVDNVTNSTATNDGRYKGWKWNSRHW